MTGRISLLVSADFRALLTVIRGLDGEVRKRIRQHTKTVAQLAWREELGHRAASRLQTVVLYDTARVSVSDFQVQLKSATVGSTEHGTRASVLAGGAEFGASANATIRQRSSKGWVYRRRRGANFPLPRARGYVVHPAAAAAIRRVGKLWAQTAYRTTAEQIEKVS